MVEDKVYIMSKEKNVIIQRRGDVTYRIEFEGQPVLVSKKIAEAALKNSPELLYYVNDYKEKEVKADKKPKISNKKKISFEKIGD